MSTNNMENGAVMENTVKPAPTWGTLPDDVKEMIVNRMGIISRNQLKWTSRDNMQLVSSIPLHLKNFKIYEKGGIACIDCADGLTIEMDNLIAQSMQSHWQLYLGEEVEDERRVYLPDDMEHFSPLYLLKKWLKRFLCTTKIRVQNFRADYDPPSELLDEDYSIRVDRLYFETFEIGSDRIMDWITLCAPGLKQIETYEEYSSTVDSSRVLRGIGLIHQVINCQGLIIKRHNDINDEQLLSFKATQLEIKHSNITCNGIRQLIKKWINEDYPVGSKFESDLKELAMVLEGLTYERLDANHLKVRIQMENGKQLIMEMKYRIEIYVEKV